MPRVTRLTIRQGLDTLVNRAAIDLSSLNDTEVLELEMKLNGSGFLHFWIDCEKAQNPKRKDMTREELAGGARVQRQGRYETDRSAKAILAELDNAGPVLRTVGLMLGPYQIRLNHTQKSEGPQPVISINNRVFNESKSFKSKGACLRWAAKTLAARFKLGLPDGCICYGDDGQHKSMCPCAIAR